MMIGNVWITRAMVPELCKTFGVHRTTVTRWIEKGRLPTAVYKLLDLLKSGRLEHIHPDWTNWTIDPRRGYLVSPVGESIQPGQILTVPYRLHELSLVKSELEDLRKNTVGETMDKFRYTQLNELKDKNRDLEETVQRLQRQIVDLNRQLTAQDRRAVFPAHRTRQ